MRLTTIAIVLTCLLLASPAPAQDWGAEDPPAVGVAKVPVEEAVVADTGFAAAASEVAKRRSGPTWRQRVNMGLGVRGIRETLKELHDEGELADLDVKTLAGEILSRSLADNPKAFMDASAGTDQEEWIKRLTQWLEAWLPFLLAIFGYLS